MRIILIIVLVALTIWVILAGLLSRKRTSRGRISWLLVFVFLIPAGVATYFEYEWRTSIDTISQTVVQPISGNPDSKLVCQRLSEAYVDAWAGEDTINSGENTVGLKYNDCAEILSYFRASSPKPVPTVEQVKSFQLLAKESTRLAGKEDNDNNLVCLGIANIPLVVEGLGGTANDGIYAYRLFRQEVQDKDTDYNKYNCK